MLAVVRKFLPHNYEGFQMDQIEQILKTKVAQATHFVDAEGHLVQIVVRGAFATVGGTCSCCGTSSRRFYGLQHQPKGHKWADKFLK